MSRAASAARAGRHGTGSIPFEALLLLVAVVVVFVHGIYLKAAGPPPLAAALPPSPAATIERPRAAAERIARPLAPAAEQRVPGFGDAGADEPSEMHGRPLIPESRSGSLAPIGTAPGADVKSTMGPSSSSPSVPSPRSAPHLRGEARAGGASRGGGSVGTAGSAPSGALVPEPGRASRDREPAIAAAPPSESSPGPFGNPAQEGVEPPAGSVAAAQAPSSMIAALAPRGEAPAAALRKARDLFGSGEYLAAAGAWNEWASRVPPGSWTVQIAAVRLDKARATGPMAALAGREGLFLLPPGGLAGGLSPVCVGIYPSEEAARRALAATAPFPGSSSRPLAKPIHALRGSGGASG